MFIGFKYLYNYGWSLAAGHEKWMHDDAIMAGCCLLFVLRCYTILNPEV